MLQDCTCESEIWNAIEVINLNFKTSIGRKYTYDDVETIWANLSQWIKESLLNNKAVLIKDLGEFTLSEWELYVGLIRPMKICQPIFILSQKLVDFFSLKRDKIYRSNKVPQQLLNYAIIAKKSKKERIMVEDCIMEVVQAFSRILSERRNVFLDFPGVGRLQIKNKVVSFIFDDKLNINSESKSDRASAVP